MQGHKTTAISKQLGEYFDLAHPYRGRAGQAEYLGGTPDSAPQRKRTTRKRKTNPCGHSQFKIHIKIPGFRRHPKEPQVRALFRPRPFPHSENGRAGQSSVLGMLWISRASRRTAYPEKKEHPCGHPRITIPGILNHKRKPQVRRVFSSSIGPAQIIGGPSEQALFMIPGVHLFIEGASQGKA